ncbi:hypothetical protein HGA88_00570 [Candidatus Roizmanbacteria bacterium]|nr:hypothetical protein [Candidatus Roizmanbacteria bacterium]
MAGEHEPFTRITEVVTQKKTKNLAPWVQRDNMSLFGPIINHCVDAHTDPLEFANTVSEIFLQPEVLNRFATRYGERNFTEEEVLKIHEQFHSVLSAPVQEYWENYTEGKSSRMLQEHGLWETVREAVLKAGVLFRNQSELVLKENKFKAKYYPNYSIEKIQEIYAVSQFFVMFFYDFYFPKVLNKKQSTDRKI